MQSGRNLQMLKKMHSFVVCVSDLLSDPDDGASIFLQIVGKLDLAHSGPLH
jgi:hypothetical protein